MLTGSVEGMKTGRGRNTGDEGVSTWAPSLLSCEG
jgi:hypothetical protein